MAPPAILSPAQTTRVVITQQPATVLARVITGPALLAELPVVLAVPPVGPVLEGPGGLGLAGPLAPALGVAAPALVRLHGALLEVRARRVVDLLVRVVDVALADQVPDGLAAAGVVGLGDLDAHLELRWRMREGGFGWAWRSRRRSGVLGRGGFDVELEMMWEVEC